MLHAKVIDQDGLSDKESRVLELLCEGQTDKMIARSLAISIKTVECHCGHIYQKLLERTDSVNNRCAAISTAVARGMVLLSTRVLVVVLMVSAAGFDDPAARVGRLQLRPGFSRVKARD